jgi:hypothetical protein
MDEETIERIVESSKRMQEVAEFTTSDDTGVLLDTMTKVVMMLAMTMKDQTNLDDVEIASAVTAAVAGMLIAWVQIEQDG